MLKEPLLTCLAILPFDQMSLVMPNMELGAFAETKLQGCSRDGEKHSCLLQPEGSCFGTGCLESTPPPTATEKVNRLALGTTTEAHNFPSPVLSNYEK